MFISTWKWAAPTAMAGGASSSKSELAAPFGLEALLPPDPAHPPSCLPQPHCLPTELPTAESTWSPSTSHVTQLVTHSTHPAPSLSGSVQFQGLSFPIMLLTQMFLTSTISEKIKCLGLRFCLSQAACRRLPVAATGWVLGSPCEPPVSTV